MKSSEERTGKGRSNKTRRSGASSRSANSSKNGSAKGGLSQKDVAYFRDLLLTKRRELVGDITSMSKEALQLDSATLSHYADDWADVGSDSQEQEFTLGLVESEHQLLKEISAALKRIEEGTFGVCEATGEPIAKARLNVKPWARYCIEAARQMEGSNGHRRG